MSIRVGSSFAMLGAGIRFLANFPAYEGKIEPNTKFWITLVGQMFIATGHPFIISLATQVSEVWFSPKERIWSTTIISLSSALGTF